MQQPVFTLNAVLHKGLPSSTKIFSIHDMEYFLWVKVDPNIARNYTLYQIDKVDFKSKIDLDVEKLVTHEPNNIWFKVNSMYLDRKAGQHVYRMHFVHKIDEHTVSLFFSYIVQTEYTTRPYDYMKHDEEAVMRKYDSDLFGLEKIQR